MSLYVNTHEIPNNGDYVKVNNHDIDYLKVNNNTVWEKQTRKYIIQNNVCQSGYTWSYASRSGWNYGRQEGSSFLFDTNYDDDVCDGLWYISNVTMPSGFTRLRFQANTSQPHYIYLVASYNQPSDSNVHSWQYPYLDSNYVYTYAESSGSVDLTLNIQNGYYVGISSGENHWVKWDITNMWLE